MAYCIAWGSSVCALASSRNTKRSWQLFVPLHNSRVARAEQRLPWQPFAPRRRPSFFHTPFIKGLEGASTRRWRSSVGKGTQLEQVMAHWCLFLSHLAWRRNVQLMVEGLAVPMGYCSLACCCCLILECAGFVRRACWHTSVSWGRCESLLGPSGFTARIALWLPWLMKTYACVCVV